MEAEIPNVQNGGHVTGCELDDLSISGQLLQGKGWLASRVNSVSWLQPETKNDLFKICQLRRNKRHFVYSVLSAFTLTSSARDVILEEHSKPHVLIHILLC